MRNLIDYITNYNFSCIFYLFIFKEQFTHKKKNTKKKIHKKKKRPDLQFPIILLSPVLREAVCVCSLRCLASIMTAVKGKTALQEFCM